ncbi:MAG: bifunctional nuclease family protein [Nitrospira sp.]|nr:bifunctional nuclease family protein [Nitrospira sp.]
MASYKLSALVALIWLLPVYSVVPEESSRSHPDPVKIAEVTVRISDHGPVVLLQAEGRTIQIFVDLTVALSIQSALNGEKLPRPMSHDLMHTILNAYGGKVTQTVITLKGGTYYGALTVAFKDQVKVFDSRSSDSIALAVHFKAPILVARDLLESAGKIPEKEKGAEL